MRKSPKRAIILSLLTLLLAAASCSKPDGRFAYVDINPAKESEGLYLFDMEIPEGKSLTAEIGCLFAPFRTDDDHLELLITAVAPDGQFYSEQCSFPLYTSRKQIPDGVPCKVKKNGNMRDITWRWRSGICSEMAGNWKINIKLADRSTAKGVYGLGFSYKSE